MSFSVHPDKTRKIVRHNYNPMTFFQRDLIGRHVFIFLSFNQILNFIVYVKPFLDLIVSVMYDMLLFAFDNVGDIENVGDKLTIQ